MSTIGTELHCLTVARFLYYITKQVHEMDGSFTLSY